MANHLNRLTARQVQTTTKTGRHADGGGLYLKISPNGGRSWTFMWKRAGKRREMGIGSAGPGGLSLAQARQKAAECREIVAQGGDPIAARDAAERGAQGGDVNFGQFADEFVADHRAAWTNPKHAAQWAMTLGDAYCRKIRKRPISEIDTDDVLAVLRPIWMKKPETARRIRMRLERVLDAARVRGLRAGENPARWRGHLDHVLPRHPKGTATHHAALPWADVPAFMDALAAREGVAALAFRFLILTACRTSEVLNARWDEIDVEEAVWEIPPERMKARRPHRVPLSAQTLCVLAQVEGLHPEWVWPNTRGTAPLSNMSLLMQLRRMGRDDITVHGFRSSFRDWVSEATNFSGEVAEAALAHTIPSKTEAAYRRGDLFEKRRRLMDAWGAFCVPAQADGTVTPIRRAASDE